MDTKQRWLCDTFLWLLQDFLHFLQPLGRGGPPLGVGSAGPTVSLSTRPPMKLLLLVLLLEAADWSVSQAPVAVGENAIDITGETVKQVESLIAKDPKLPRLTRGEIVSLIQEVRNVSARGDKSLLVVLPVSEAGNQDLQELYTKEAVTRYVGEPPSTTTSRPKRRRKKPTQPRPVYEHSSGTPVLSSPATLSSSRPTSSSDPSLITFTTSKPQGFQKPYREDLSLPDSMRETLVDISVNPTESPALYVTPQKVTARPTSAPVPSDVKNTADALTPDIKQVLNSIGLFGETTTTEKSSFLLKSVAPSIDPSTFSRFKPLPSGSDVSDDMKSFLKSFGLLEAPSRQKKAMSEPVDDEEGDAFINEDILTDDMKDILRNIGLLDRKDKKIHVFNPQAESSKLNQTEHMLKINKILKKLREVSEGGNENITQDELKELLALEGVNDTTRTLLDSELDSALLNADEYQSLESVKTEVKRQQPNISAEASASASSNSEGSSASASASASAGEGASASASASASSEGGTTALPIDSTADSVSEASESTDPTVSAATDATERSPSLDELADSFGGAEISTRRPNGFYFMVDWNSFLDVGLDDRKISLNFSPKVGDPKNFLPVTFP